MKFFLFLFLFLALSFCFSALGQEADLDSGSHPRRAIARLYHTTWLQDLLEAFPELIIDEELQQTINELVARPVSLNTCTREDLLRIPGLTPVLAASILRHREVTGNYQSLYELQVIEGMNSLLFAYIKHVVSIRGGPYLAGSKTQKGEYLLLLHPQFHSKEEAAKQNYSGPPIRQWHRFKWSMGKHLTLAFSLENDAGEAFRWDKKQKGFDFGTLFMDYRNPQKGLHIILGDYRVNSGQGLVHGTAGSFGSAAWVGRVFQQDNARGYRSSDENLFLRGVFFEKTSGRWRNRVFVSHLRSDGRVTGDEVNETGSGLHRTESEFALRKQMKRSSLGQSLRYSLKGGELSWQNLLVKEGSWLSYQTSLYHQFNLRQVMVFGEWAYGHYGFSGIQAVVLAMSPQFELSSVVRFYPRNNGNPYAGGFSEFSTPENERGVYVSAEYRSHRNRTWRFYSDWAYRPFPSYLVAKAYWNTTHFIQSEKKLGGVLTLFRIQRETGEKDINKEELVWKRTQAWTNTKIRLQLEGKYAQDWIYKSRVEYSFFEHDKQEKGVLLFHEIQWRPLLKPYYLIFRYTHFTVSDYNARLYAYESDVLYAFSVPMFSGRGQRVYLLYRQGLGRNFDVWFKVAYTRYEGESLGKWEAKVLVKCGF